MHQFSYVKLSEGLCSMTSSRLLWVQHELALLSKEDCAMNWWCLQPFSRMHLDPQAKWEFIPIITPLLSIITIHHCWLSPNIQTTPYIRDDQIPMASAILFPIYHLLVQHVLVLNYIRDSSPIILSSGMMFRF